MSAHLAWLDYLRLNPGAWDDFRAWVADRTATALRDELETKDWPSTLGARLLVKDRRDFQRLIDAPEREAAQRERSRR